MSVTFPAGSPPPAAGISLKAQHMSQLLERRPALGFLEIHAENYLSAGGPGQRWLTALAEHYPLSIHGVGLSLGSDQPLDVGHLDRLAALVARTGPMLVSEHLAWSVFDGRYLNDLLPIPYDQASLRLVARHLDQLQTRLRRPVLVENPASTIAFNQSTLDEAQFLAELSRLSGCGILLDINNLFVSHVNVGLKLDGYFAALPAGAIGEIHLAGHLRRDIALAGGGSAEIRIDDHGSAVCDAVWELYRDALRQFGARPTLIERDSNIPPLDALLAEADAAHYLQQTETERHAATA
jgi:hypothetical protein